MGFFRWTILENGRNLNWARALVSHVALAGLNTTMIQHFQNQCGGPALRSSGFGDWDNVLFALDEPGSSSRWLFCNQICVLDLWHFSYYQAAPLIPLIFG